MSFLDAATTGTALRSANRRRVMQVLQTGTDEASQAELARMTGLSPATVGTIVRDLADAGLVRTEAGAGRRGGRVRISANAGVVVGIDFGHRHLRVVVADLSGAVITEDVVEIPTDHDAAWGLDRAVELLTRLTRGQGHGTLLGVGLGLPAPLDSRGLVTSSTILPGWEGVDPLAAARARLSVPVHVDNDANLGALAEHRLGAGRGHPSLVFVKASSGLGSGIVIDGQIFRGSAGMAGELGHLTRDPDGPLCRCGSRGCLEAYVSVGAVMGALGGLLPDAEFDEVVAAARGGNSAAARAFEDAGLHLGWGLAMIANLLNPSAVVVGGRVAEAGDLLLDPIRGSMRRHMLASLYAATTVAPASLSGRASALGAMLLALDSTDLVAEMERTG